MTPLLHSGVRSFGWHDWPWVVALAIVVGLVWLVLTWLNRRARR